MARQKSIFILEGTIGGVTFYKTKNGFLAKAKSGVSGERVRKDPCFARTRENSAEFKAAAHAGKLLRDSVRPLMYLASDSCITARVTQLMSRVQKKDVDSARGCRLPAKGIKTSEGKALMKLFNFNKDSILHSILLKPYLVNSITGEISIMNFVPARDLMIPEGATNFRLIGGMLVIDFFKGTYDLRLTNAVDRAIDETPVTVTLAPTALPTGSGVKLFFLKLEYFQKVNEEPYSLNNGEFNSLEIIEVI